MNTAEAARLLSRYAKEHAAGGFATPSAKELGQRPAALVTWVDGPDALVVVQTTLTRESARTDWTGRKFTLPKGSRVATHVARTSGFDTLPSFDEFDVVTCYADDHLLAEAMRLQHRVPLGTRISASSEILTLWGRPGDQPARYDAIDSLTVGRLPASARYPKMLSELDRVTEWADDYPFYSDGTWGQACLRGFWPDDPGRGIKPLEMGKTWMAEHPADVARKPEWTQLSRACPAMMAALSDLAPKGFERVRLMRMAGRDGLGGKLARHTDITDKTAGAEVGQIARFHLPLVTHDDIRMSVWRLDGVRHEVHLAPGSWWYLDARKPHAVTNPTGVDRVHLVADVIVTADLRDRLAAAEVIA